MRFSTRRGLSLVEIMVSMAILAVIISTIYEVLSISTDVVNTGSVKAKLEDDTRKVLDTIAREVRGASLSSLDCDPATIGAQKPEVAAYPSGSSYLSFNVVANVDSSFAAQTYATSTIRWIIDPQEILNGLDDDHDGLVDEGYIEMTTTKLNNIDDDGDGIVDEADDGDPVVVEIMGENIAPYFENEMREIPGNGVDDDNDGLVDEPFVDGVDDNANGLTDEPGLCFTYDNSSGLLTIRLTLNGLNNRRELLTADTSITFKLQNP